MRAVAMLQALSAVSTRTSSIIASFDSLPSKTVLYFRNLESSHKRCLWQKPQSVESTMTEIGLIKENRRVAIVLDEFVVLFPCLVSEYFSASRVFWVRRHRVVGLSRQEACHGVPDEDSPSPVSKVPTVFS